MVPDSPLVKITKREFRPGEFTKLNRIFSNENIGPEQVALYHKYQVAYSLDIIR